MEPMCLSGKCSCWWCLPVLSPVLLFSLDLLSWRVAQKSWNNYNKGNNYARALLVMNKPLVSRAANRFRTLDPAHWQSCEKQELYCLAMISDSYFGSNTKPVDLVILSIPQWWAHGYWYTSFYIASRNLTLATLSTRKGFVQITVVLLLCCPPPE